MEKHLTSMNWFSISRNTKNAKSVNDIYKIALNDLTVPFSFRINISSYLNNPFIAKSIQFCKDENIDINNHQLRRL